jgi:hypothetical protein
MNKFLVIGINVTLNMENPEPTAPNLDIGSSPGIKSNLWDKEEREYSRMPDTRQADAEHAQHSDPECGDACCLLILSCLFLNSN